MLEGSNCMYNNTQCQGTLTMFTTTHNARRIWLYLQQPTHNWQENLTPCQKSLTVCTKMHSDRSLWLYLQQSTVTRASGCVYNNSQCQETSTVCTPIHSNMRLWLYVQLARHRWLWKTPKTSMLPLGFIRKQQL
jgi:hypothetical protein